MGVASWIIGISFGIVLGIGVAYLLTFSLVKNSNDSGDWASTLSDVSPKGLVIFEQEDHLKEKDLVKYHRKSKK